MNSTIKFCTFSANRFTPNLSGFLQAKSDNVANDIGIDGDQSYSRLKTIHNAISATAKAYGQDAVIGAYNDNAFYTLDELIAVTEEDGHVWDTLPEAFDFLNQKKSQTKSGPLDALNWIKTKLDSGQYQLPKEGCPVIIKCSTGYFTAHVVYSGGAKFHCVSPTEDSAELQPKDVEQWAYIEDELGIILY